MSKWYQVKRVVHLPGGIRAINDPGSKVSLYPPGKKGVPSLELPSYHSLLQVMNDLGLPVLGISYYETKEELDGLYPPVWMTYHHARKGFDVQQKWSNIGHGARGENSFELMDNAFRIAFELDNCIHAIQDISNSYNKELTAKCLLDGFVDGQRFETLNSKKITTTVHAFFSTAGTVRDYLGSSGQSVL